MLLELHDLDSVLRAAGITPKVTEKRIQPYPRRVTLEVRLDRYGRVTGLKRLADDQVRAIRKFESSQGGSRESTPGFNVEPLWRTSLAREGRLPDDWPKDWKKAWKAAATKPEKLAGLLTQRARFREPNWDLTASSKINLCLQGAAALLRRELDGATDPRLAALHELLRRSECLDAVRLHAALADALLAATTGSAGIDALDCCALLYSSRESASAKTASNETFSLVLELDDATGFGGYPANHEIAWDALSEHLIRRPHSNIGGQKLGVFGEVLPDRLGSMAERTLPRLGKVKLFSLNAQTRCQERYGLIESDACPVGPETQDRLSAALEWVCRDERQGETWDDVSGSCGYPQPAILIAYPNKMSRSGMKTAGLFVKRSGDSEAGEESGFENRARDLVKALKGELSENRDLTFSVMVIAKADKARKKLLYSRQFTAQRLIAAASEWQEAARNIPPTFVRVFEKAGKPRWCRPLTPFPDEVVRVVNTCWESSGERSKTASSARIGLALGLLLETGPPLDEVVREAVRPLVLNVTPLVLAMARAHSQGRVHKAGGDIQLRVPAVLGLVLAKAGHWKEDYMSSNAYLIGRLLSLADEFHRFYCDQERDRNKPPQLIGNALMPTALDNPVAGLARLSERFTLYQRVADGPLRDRLGEVERDIDKATLKDRCTDLEKAQMLLGYIARPDLEGRNEGTPTTETDNLKEPQS